MPHPKRPRRWLFILTVGIFAFVMACFIFGGLSLLFDQPIRNLPTLLHTSHSVGGFFYEEMK